MASNVVPNRRVWGLLKENSLIDPNQGTPRQMANPPVSQVIESGGIAVSRHAEFIFDDHRISAPSVERALTNTPFSSISRARRIVRIRDRRR